METFNDMTTAIFLILFFAFFIAGLNFLPVADTTPPVLITSIGTLVGYMKAWNFLFPISELFWAVSIFIGFELTMFIWYALNWVFRKIRGATH